MVSRIEMGLSLDTTKAVKPLLRHSTLSTGSVRKSDEASLDSDIDMLLTLPSPRKRAKVTFNPNVEEKVMEEYSRSLDSVRREVRMAIEAHVRGSSDVAYNRIKEIFSPRQEDEDEDEQPSNEEMRAYILALAAHASLLNKNCADIIKTLLSFEWMGRDERFVRAYVQFLGSLATSQGAIVINYILDMLTRNFAGVRFSSGRLHGCPDVSREQLLSRVHAAMKYLLHLIPSASSNLLPQLSPKFPTEDDSKASHLIYVKNLFHLVEYAPELKAEVLSLITDRLVNIDVHMQTDLEDVDDDIVAAVVDALSLSSSRIKDEAEEEEMDGDADSDTSDEDMPIQTRRAKEIHSKVEKMDAMIDQLFTYYEPVFESPDSPAAIALFDTLIGHFETIILPTYSSRHTQFLLFHYAQKSETFMDKFAGHCVAIAFDKSRPAVLQQSAAAYLASFVARGKHVETETVRVVFQLFGDELKVIRQKEEANCRGPNLQRYTTYYTMTQALLYIFCFRWRDLVDSPDILEEDDPDAFIKQDFNWVPGVKEILTQTIYSKLNPLKVCCAPIVTEFAKITRHLSFMYVYPLLEKNERIHLSQFAGSHASGRIRDAGVAGRNENWHQLDAQFPFDPYQLPISKHWVEPDYVQWKGLPGLEEEYDESDDEIVDDCEDDEAEENTGTDDDFEE